MADTALAGDAAAERIVLSAGTPASSISTFALGRQVTLAFKATGLKPGQDDLTLELHFVDEADRTVKKQSLVVKADGLAAGKGGVIAETVEGNRLQKPRRDDPIGVDVVPAHRNRGALDTINAARH